VKLPFTILFLVTLSASLLAQSPSQNPAPASPAPQSVAPAQSAAPEKSPSSAPSQPAETLPLKYVELWNTGNPDIAKTLVPFVIFTHGHRNLVNPVMLNNVVSTWRKSMPDLTFKVEDTVIQGDKVAMRLTFTGTYTTRLFPNTMDPATMNPKRKIRGTETLLFQLKDGKLWQIWEEYDEVAMRIQMGGQWRSNQELDAAASGQTPKPASGPETAPPAKP